MKKTLSIIFLLALSFTVYCQTSHTVSSGSYYYYPSTLTISLGDTVHWVNDGGLHNVNFDNNLDINSGPIPEGSPNKTAILILFRGIFFT